MRFLPILLLSALLGGPGLAQQAPQSAAAVLDMRPAEGLTLDEFRWRARLIVVFADSPLDPLFQEQMKLLQERPEDLIERDVVVITDTDPARPSPIRRKLRPRGFGLVFVDKDGAVKLRKPKPWDVREISRSIDKTELRQQELREERANGS